VKTGLLFGSFNPIHLGHLVIAEYFASHGGMDEVWLIVSPQNPFKQNQELAPAEDRLAMVRLAVRDNSKVKASDFEFSMPRPSYTIDTLSALDKAFPERSFYLLLGEDLLGGFTGWKDYQKILDRGKILVYPRNHGTTPVIDLPVLPAPRLDISSTFIRKSLLDGHSVKYLLPDVVLNYIDTKGLYRR
jgi:nicotinate-nucleotide adenylyltransferase